MSNLTSVPHPGYKSSKPYIQPVRVLFSELGAQDACLQLQEVSIVHLEKSAQAMNAHMKDYLKLLYKSNSIPLGTYSFPDMRAQIYKSFIVLTHSVFDNIIKQCNKAYQDKHPNNQWVTTLKGGAALHPLQQLCYNCTEAENSALTHPPEFRLIEYYRRIRIASVHPSLSTKQDADSAFSNLTPSDYLHFRKYENLSCVPNPPGLLTFEDFQLYTRSIKYYINIVNDVCA